MHRTTLYREPGRFAGWPANYGLWAWGEEVLAMFIVGYVAPQEGVHPRDTSRPFTPVLARSFDHGDTWTYEEFTGTTPGGQTLSGDEHVDHDLKSRPHLTDGDFAPLTEPIDFTDPDTVVLCARTDLENDSVSWFYVSPDRGRTWSAPHRLPGFDLAGVSARTDIVPLGQHHALFMLTGTKSNTTEGRVFAARTDDGGQSFERVGYVGPEPDGWSIMPSSLRLEDGSVISALRCSEPGPDGTPATHWIDLYRSTDDGQSWEHLARPVQSTGAHGNPPAMVRASTGALVIVYGYRDEPRGLRYVTSSDDGATWSDPVTLTDDTPTHDMGYPRAVALDTGEILAIYYSNAGPLGERFIDSVKWTI